MHSKFEITMKCKTGLFLRYYCFKDYWLYTTPGWHQSDCTTKALTGWASSPCSEERGGIHNHHNATESDLESSRGLKIFDELDWLDIITSGVGCFTSGLCLFRRANLLDLFRAKSWWRPCQSLCSRIDEIIPVENFGEVWKDSNWFKKFFVLG
jgi:hypothetical protein